MSAPHATTPGAVAIARPAIQLSATVMEFLVVLGNVTSAVIPTSATPSVSAILVNVFLAGAL